MTKNASINPQNPESPKMIPISKLEIQQSVVIAALRAENAKLRGLLGRAVMFVIYSGESRQLHDDCRAALNRGEKP